MRRVRVSAGEQDRSRVTVRRDATAYERSSVLLTTNLPFEHWTEVLGNERLTGTALDRLTHSYHIVETTGKATACRTANDDRPQEI